MSDYIYDVIVINVHDGDTVKLDIDLGYGAWLRSWNIRLYGTNAPELNTLAGQESQKFLNNLIPPGTKLELESYKDKADKYGGRWLGSLILNNQNLNDLMVSSGHAVYWDGKGPKP